MNKGRKISGAKYHTHRKKKLYERQSQARVVTMNKETRRKSLRVRGGSDKILLLTTNKVNLVIDGKVKKAEEQLQELNRWLFSSALSFS